MTESGLKPISDLELGWAAGFFEGEGCITFVKDRLSVCLYVDSTNKRDVTVVLQLLTPLLMSRRSQKSKEALIRLNKMIGRK